MGVIRSRRSRSRSRLERKRKKFQRSELLIKMLPGFYFSFSELQNCYNHFSFLKLSVRRSDGDRRHRCLWLPFRSQRLLASALLRLLCLQRSSGRFNLLPSRGAALLWSPSCRNFEAALLRM